MSAGLSSMSITESDVTKLLAANTHLGANSVNFQMEPYVHKRRADGVNIINLQKTYEKMVLGSRALAAIENPADVYVISSRPIGQRAVLKFARHIGATPIAGRFTPGAFTNQIQAAFREPRLLVVTDPQQDHQPITEASYVNIPVIALCNTDSPLTLVDVAIPCNNKSAQAVGLMWWMLAREVLRLRGTISRNIPWESEVMPDLFFYRDPEEQEKEEAARAEAAKEAEVKPEPVAETWGTTEVVEETTPAATAGAGAGTGTGTATGTAAPAAAPKISEEWGQTQTEDWATQGGDDWGGDSAVTWN